MRLLSEVKGKMSKISKVTVVPEGVVSRYACPISEGEC